MQEDKQACAQSEDDCYKDILKRINPAEMALHPARAIRFQVAGKFAKPGFLLKGGL